MNGNILSEQFSDGEDTSETGNHNNQQTSAILEGTSQQPEDTGAIEAEAASTTSDKNDKIGMNEINHDEQDNNNPMDNNIDDISEDTMSNRGDV